MNETTVTLVGNAATDVRYRQSPTGVPVASFRMASTTRRWDRERQQWEDGHTSFFTVWAWRGLAGNVAASVGRGDPLVVQGRMRVREWERDGRRHTAVEVDAGVVGHDLSRGTSAFRRGMRAQLVTQAQPVPGGAVPGGLPVGRSEAQAPGQAAGLPEPVSGAVAEVVRGLSPVPPPALGAPPPGPADGPDQVPATTGVSGPGQPGAAEVTAGQSGGPAREGDGPWASGAAEPQWEEECAAVG